MLLSDICATRRIRSRDFFVFAGGHKATLSTGSFFAFCECHAASKKLRKKWIARCCKSSRTLGYLEDTSTTKNRGYLNRLVGPATLLVFNEQGDLVEGTRAIAAHMAIDGCVHGIP